jgi:uncharacterized protein (TIGR00255 family)
MSARSLTSMTGFARLDGSMSAPLSVAWAWEIRSVNGKSLDVRLRLPSGFDSLDGPVRRLATEHVSRGSLSITLTLNSTQQSQAAAINETLLDQLIALAAKKAQSLPAGVGPASLDGLMAVKGVIESAEPQLDAAGLAERDRQLLDSFRQALGLLQASRAEEGARLAVVLQAQLAKLKDLVAAATANSAAQPAAIKARFERQIADMTSGGQTLAPERLAQEIAMLAVKADIREELDRLKSHLVQAADLLAAAGPCGRRLDFLTQELNREANTLCSKAQDVDLTRIGLDLKATIDQVREQIQNIE